MECTFVAAGVPPAVEPGILPGGGSAWAGEEVSGPGRRDAALYGRRDACRYGRDLEFADLTVVGVATARTRVFNREMVPRLAGETGAGLAGRAGVGQRQRTG